MQTGMISSAIYKHLHGQMFDRADGEQVKLLPNQAKALGLTSFVLDFHNQQGYKWFTTSSGLTGMHYSIMLQNNCLNVAKFNDIQCLDNTILLSDDEKALTYGFKKGNRYWGFIKDLIPEAIPLEIMPTANAPERNDYSLNTLFWHNMSEVILPLYEEDARTLYVTKQQREVLDQNLQAPCLFIKENDKIYGHGLSDLFVETIGIDKDLGNTEKEVEDKELALA